MNEDNTIFCNWCNKHFVNVYVLKRHTDKCKLKKDSDYKELEDKCYKMQRTITSLESKIKNNIELEEKIVQLTTQLEKEIKKKIHI